MCDSKIEEMLDAARRQGLEEAASIVTEHYQALSVEHRLLLLDRATRIRNLASPAPAAAQKEDGYARLGGMSAQIWRELDEKEKRK